MMVRRLLVGVAVLALVATACGDDTAATTVATAPAGTVVTSAPAAAAEQAQTSASTVAATTTTLPATTLPPGIAAMTSGRGDDGSLEIGVWFSANPFEAGEARLLVGTDADESYPGIGDPVPHIDGWANLTDGATELLDDGTVVSDATTGDLNEWLSWTGPGQQAWFYFSQNVPVRAGTVWIVLELDGDMVSIAGASFGDGCSYHSAGVDLGPVPGDVPDFGIPCRYPINR